MATDGDFHTATRRYEHIHLDSRRQEYGAAIGWSGPAIAPLAVAAVYHLYGSRALLEHPALYGLRRETAAARSVSRRRIPAHQA